MKKYLIIFVLFTIVSCTDRVPDPSYIHKIQNLSSHNVIINTYIDQNFKKAIVIDSQSTYEIKLETASLFNYNDDRVSFVFDNEKELNYYYDSIDTQTINNPYFSKGHGFVCEDNPYVCVYTITNEDYDRAELIR